MDVCVSVVEFRRRMSWPEHSSYSAHFLFTNVRHRSGETGIIWVTAQTLGFLSNLTHLSQSHLSPSPLSPTEIQMKQKKLTITNCLCCGVQRTPNHGVFLIQSAVLEWKLSWSSHGSTEWLFESWVRRNELLFLRTQCAEWVAASHCKLDTISCPKRVETCRMRQWILSFTL